VEWVGSALAGLTHFGTLGVSTARGRRRWSTEAESALAHCDPSHTPGDYVDITCPVDIGVTSPR